VKTVLNNIWTHIGHEDDGRLVHTDKRTGMQFVSVKAWPSLVSARQALDAGFSKIEMGEIEGAAARRLEERASSSRTRS
jgi:hypothetical protein